MTSVPSRHWRTLAALLAPDIADPDRPAIGPIEDWPALYGLATAQLVAPSLYAGRQAWTDCFSLPANVRDALAYLHELNDARNRRLHRVLRETVATSSLSCSRAPSPCCRISTRWPLRGF